MSNRWTGGFIQAYFDPLTAGPAVPSDPGELYVVGKNSLGQLGINNVISGSSPVQIDSSANWQEIAAGQNHSLAVKSDGTLWTWGYNHRGQLGQNTLVNVSSPVQVGALTTWSKATAGNEHSLALKTDGTLWSWGQNGTGMLGDNTSIMRSSPVQIGALTDWSKISGANEFSLAIKTDGTLWAWGNARYGGPGLNIGGTGVYKSSPTQVGALTTWMQVGGGSYFAHAIKTDNTLWALGGVQSFGRLGDGVAAFSYRSSPVQIGALSNWSKVSDGAFGGTALKTDGTLWAWGNGSSGTMGQNSAVATNASPLQVGSLTSWSDVVGSDYHIIATQTDLSVWSWGTNNTGQLGQNTTSNVSSPTQIGADTDWLKVADGVVNTHTLFTKAS